MQKYGKGVKAMDQWMYVLDYTHSAEEAMQITKDFLEENHMLLTESGNFNDAYVINARDQAGDLVQWLGLDRRMTVTFLAEYPDKLYIRVSGLRWGDKLLVGMASGLLCILSVMAVVGIIRQFQLVNGLKKILDDYFGKERLMIAMCAESPRKRRQADIVNVRKERGRTQNHDILIGVSKKKEVVNL